MSSDGPESPDGRGARTRKKAAQIICPICGVTVRSQVINRRQLNRLVFTKESFCSQEIDAHLALEMQRLEKTSTTSVNKIRKERSTAETSEASTSTAVNPGSSSSSGTGMGSGNNDSAWGTYQKIKSNRQTRLKVSGSRGEVDSIEITI